MKRLVTALLLLVFALPAVSAFAQSAQESLQAGMLAFRDGRYQEAADALERTLEQDPENTQALFLLARLYAETPLKDRRKAQRALDRALELDPDNLGLLVGRLQVLREDSWNTIIDRIREARRIDLAKRILRLDSTNAFAHEELGDVYIRDFWEYRNMVMLPMLDLRQRSFHSNKADLRNELGPIADNGQNIGNVTAQDGDSRRVSTGLDRTFLDDGGKAMRLDPDQVFLADRFDLTTMEQQGGRPIELSGRAQRAFNRAVGHLEAALATDPRRRPVYDQLMRIFALKGEYQAAAASLSEMYTYFPEDAELWLYLGLTNYHVGRLDAAAKAFETAFQYMDEEMKQAYTSLDHILPPAEKARYETDPEVYASRFWNSKDPRFLTPYNERQLEHYARLTYADLLYGDNELNLRGWNTERGHILVRYGHPRYDAVFQGTSESMADKDALDQRHVLDVAGDTFDMLEESNRYNVWEYGDFRFVFEDPFRNGEYRMYSPSADDLADGVDPWLNDYVIRAKETYKKIPERYEFEAPGRQVELPYLVAAFKAEEGADVYVNYGIPIAQYDPAAAMVNLTANVGAFLISDLRDILVERRRTIYGLRTSQIVAFPEVNLWVDTQHMAAPSGDHEVSLEFETASGQTVGVQRRAITVPDYHGDRLTLSDLLLAYGVEESFDGKPVRAGDIVRHGLSIAPAPWSVFELKQPIYLYFEVYNLEANAAGRTDYEIEAQLVPRGDDGRVKKLLKGLFGSEKGVSVTLPGSGTRTDDGQYTILDVGEQEPGLYTLVLRVHDNVANRTVETKQDLFLQ